MTPVHCEADMPEIERLRAELRDAREAAVSAMAMYTEASTRAAELRADFDDYRAAVCAISDDIAAWQGEAAALATHEGNRTGGFARALALTPERRRDIARNAGKARWRKVRDVLDDSQPMEAPPCD